MTEWIIPCDPNAYDVFGAFAELKKVGWKQSTNIEPGDMVYIYVGYSYGSIRFKCLVQETNLEYVDIDDSKYDLDDTNYGAYHRHMVLEWLQKYDTPLLARKYLMENGLKQVQGPSKATPALSAYIHQTEESIRNKQPDYTRAEKLSPTLRGGQAVYPRNPQTAENALLYANDTCEINPNHPSFLRRNSDRPYMEAHHLVPLSCFEQFDTSLDVEANIVCLCSNCHREIHYGKYAEFLIRKLYRARKKHLQKAGISITLAQLLQMYP